jgi:predicted nucleic acid-binding protein
VRRVSIDDCNAQRIVVLFDANVVIGAIRRPEMADLMLRVQRSLRRTSATVRYEVLEARGIESPESLARRARDERWMVDHMDVLPLGEREAKVFTALLARRPAVPRGSAKLGDALLACFARAVDAGTRHAAIATLDGDDFDRFGVALVSEFRAEV